MLSVWWLKYRKYMGLVLNTKPCRVGEFVLKFKLKPSPWPRAGCSHNAEEELEGLGSPLSLADLPLHQGPGFLKAFVSKSKQLQIRSYAFHLSSSLQGRSCRRAMSQFSSLQAAALCQHRPFGRGQSCLGAELLSAQATSRGGPFITDVAQTFALIPWRMRISSCCSTKDCNAKVIN